MKQAITGALIGAALAIATIAISQNVPQESPVYHAARPGDGSTAITPNDDEDLVRRARSLYIEGEGNVTFTALDGTTDTWAVPANFYLNVQVVRVFQTGTTATGIHAIH